MKLKRTSDDEELEAVIKKLISEDFDLLEDSQRFVFDWSIERRSDVYKITLISDVDNILGLIMIIDYPSESRIHIDLLESSKENTGANKEFDNIAGCLIAFTASLSFERGYSGYVSLDPKSQLIELYRNKYGFEEAGYMMVSQLRNSQELINKYLNYDEGE